MNKPEHLSILHLSDFADDNVIDLGHFPTLNDGDFVGGHVYPPNDRCWLWSTDSLMLFPLSAATIQDAMTAYKNLAVVNFNVLEWLLRHQGLIPEEWRRYSIHFLGTFFTKKAISSPFIYYLEYREEGWVALEARYNSRPNIGKAQLLLFR